MLKKIEGFDNYFVFSGGLVINMKFGKRLPLATEVNKAGYEFVRLHKDGRRHGRKIHRLVAEAFLPNPENKRTVNHKNGIKTDNRVENLEWATHSENTLHSYRVLRRGIYPPDPSKAVRCIETGVEYKSLTEAARSVGVSIEGIRRAANGKQHTSGGYRWEII